VLVWQGLVAAFQAGAAPRPGDNRQTTGSVAGLTVDRFADQVGVSVVPGEFLDHVRQHPAERDGIRTASGRMGLAQRRILTLAELRL